MYMNDKGMDRLEVRWLRDRRRAWRGDVIYKLLDLRQDGGERRLHESLCLQYGSGTGVWYERAGGWE